MDRGQVGIGGAAEQGAEYQPAPDHQPASISSTLSWWAARAENRREVTPGRSRPVRVTRRVSCAASIGAQRYPAAVAGAHGFGLAGPA